MQHFEITNSQAEERPRCPRRRSSLKRNRLHSTRSSRNLTSSNQKNNFPLGGKSNSMKRAASFSISRSSYAQSRSRQHVEDNRRAESRARIASDIVASQLEDNDYGGIISPRREQKLTEVNERSESKWHSNRENSSNHNSSSRSDRKSVADDSGSESYLQQNRLTSSSMGHNQERQCESGDIDSNIEENRSSSSSSLRRSQRSAEDNKPAEQSRQMPDEDVDSNGQQNRRSRSSRSRPNQQSAEDSNRVEPNRQPLDENVASNVVSSNRQENRSTDSSSMRDLQSVEDSRGNQSDKQPNHFARRNSSGTVDQQRGEYNAEDFDSNRQQNCSMHSSSSRRGRQSIEDKKRFGSSRQPMGEDVDPNEHESSSSCTSTLPCDQQPMKYDDRALHGRRSSLEHNQQLLGDTAGADSNNEEISRRGSPSLRCDYQSARVGKGNESSRQRNRLERRHSVSLGHNQQRWGDSEAVTSRRQSLPKNERAESSRQEKRLRRGLSFAYNQSRRTSLGCSQQHNTGNSKDICSSDRNSSPLVSKSLKRAASFSTLNSDGIQPHCHQNRRRRGSSSHCDQHTLGNSVGAGLNRLKHCSGRRLSLACDQQPLGDAKKIDVSFNDSWPKSQSKIEKNVRSSENRTTDKSTLGCDQQSPEKDSAGNIRDICSRKDRKASPGSRSMKRAASFSILNNDCVQSPNYRNYLTRSSSLHFGKQAAGDREIDSSRSHRSSEQRSLGDSVGGDSNSQTDCSGLACDQQNLGEANSIDSKSRERLPRSRSRCDIVTSSENRPTHGLSLGLDKHQHQITDSGHDGLPPSSRSRKSTGKSDQTTKTSTPTSRKAQRTPRTSKSNRTPSSSSSHRRIKLSSAKIAPIDLENDSTKIEKSSEKKEMNEQNHRIQINAKSKESMCMTPRGRSSENVARTPKPKGDRGKEVTAKAATPIEKKRASKTTRTPSKVSSSCIGPVDGNGNAMKMEDSSVKKEGIEDNETKPTTENQHQLENSGKSRRHIGRHRKSSQENMTTTPKLTWTREAAVASPTKRKTPRTPRTSRAQRTPSSTASGNLKLSPSRIVPIDLDDDIKESSSNGDGSQVDRRDFGTNEQQGANSDRPLRMNRQGKSAEESRREEGTANVTTPNKKSTRTPRKSRAHGTPASARKRKMQLSSAKITPIELDTHATKFDSNSVMTRQTNEQQVQNNPTSKQSDGINHRVKPSDEKMTRTWKREVASAAGSKIPNAPGGINHRGKSSEEKMTRTWKREVASTAVTPKTPRGSKTPNALVAQQSIIEMEKTIVSSNVVDVDLDDSGMAHSDFSEKEVNHAPINVSASTNAGNGGDGGGSCSDAVQSPNDGSSKQRLGDYLDAQSSRTPKATLKRKCTLKASPHTFGSPKASLTPLTQASTERKVKVLTMPINLENDLDNDTALTPVSSESKSEVTSGNDEQQGAMDSKRQPSMRTLPTRQTGVSPHGIKKSLSTSLGGNIKKRQGRTKRNLPPASKQVDFLKTQLYGGDDRAASPAATKEHNNTNLAHLSEESRNCFLKTNAIEPQDEDNNAKDTDKGNSTQDHNSNTMKEKDCENIEDDLRGADNKQKNDTTEDADYEKDTPPDCRDSHDDVGDDNSDEEDEYDEYALDEYDDFDDEGKTIAETVFDDDTSDDESKICSKDCNLNKKLEKIDYDDALVNMKVSRALKSIHTGTDFGLSMRDVFKSLREEKLEKLHMNEAENDRKKLNLKRVNFNKYGDEISEGECSS